MRDYHDSARLRVQDDDDQEDRESLDREPAQPAAECVMVTDSDGSYPVTPSRFFKVRPLVILGTEQEGQPGTFTTMEGALYAYNVGSVVPPQGVRVLVTFVPNRHVFEYNG